MNTMTKRGRPRATKPLDKHVLLRLDAADIARLDAERERLYDAQGLQLDRSQLLRWIVRQYLAQVEKEGPDNG